MQNEELGNNTVLSHSLRVLANADPGQSKEEGSLERKGVEERVERAIYLRTLNSILFIWHEDGLCQLFSAALKWNGCHFDAKHRIYQGKHLSRQTVRPALESEVDRDGLSPWLIPFWPATARQVLLYKGLWGIVRVKWKRYIGSIRLERFYRLFQHLYKENRCTYQQTHSSLPLVQAAFETHNRSLGWQVGQK